MIQRGEVMASKEQSKSSAAVCVRRCGGGWGGMGSPQGQGEAAEPGARKFRVEVGAMKAGGAWLAGGG